MNEKYLRRVVEQDFMDVPNRYVLAALMLVLDEVRKINEREVERDRLSASLPDIMHMSE